MPSEVSALYDSAWRAEYGPEQTLQRVRPLEDKGYLPNPHRGTTTFQRFNGDSLYPGLTWSDREGPIEFKPFDGNLKNPQYPNTTVSYCRWLWSVLEPEKGKFRWDIIDGTLAAARARGQTVQMRIQPYIGGEMPPWYYATGATKQPLPPETPPDPVWGGGGKPIAEPEHNDPKYLEHFGGIIRAFGQRYDGHPDLESFDVAYGGGCGEGGGNATPETAAKLVDVYLQNFKKTQLITMLGTPGCRHAAKHRNVGWRADCFGDVHRVERKGVIPKGMNWNHMFDYYPESVHDCGLSDHWKTAPVVLETCWTVGYWAKQGWDIDWILEQGLKYHTTIFMPKSSFIPDEWREKIDAFDRKLGYRFVLRQAMLPLQTAPAGRINVKFWIENVGVAPLYRAYQFALRFSQGSQKVIVPLKSDPRTWLPGDVIVNEELKVPEVLQRGTVSIDAGIIDPQNQAAKVVFATARGEDRWHALTKLDVK